MADWIGTTVPNLPLRDPVEEDDLVYLAGLVDGEYSDFQAPVSAIGGGGSVALPYLRATKNSNQTVSTAAGTLVVWNVIDSDLQGWFSSNAWTPQLAGLYAINAMVGVNAVPSGNNINTRIWFNGSRLQDGNYFYNNAAGTQFCTSAVWSILPFNGSTDYLEIFLAYNGAGSRTINGDPRWCWLMISYLGALAPAPP